MNKAENEDQKARKDSFYYDNDFDFGTLATKISRKCRRREQEEKAQTPFIEQ